jgi:2-methylcitrate dehydratase PrpD
MGMAALSSAPFSSTMSAQESSPSKADQPVSPAMAKLSAYMSDARTRPIPNDAVEKTKQHILDTIAAMVSGSELPAGRAALQFARTYGGSKVATVVASDILCGPLEASIVNAELAHSDETDDYYHMGGAHPGCSIVPATLAAGEQFGISGAHFLRAVALGYDIGLRVTEILFAAGSSENHSVVGTFGSAAGAGCAASLNAQQMRWVLDYAAQQARAGVGAWKRDSQHIEKGFVFAGAGARNGVTAALLVQSGWTGVSDIMSGPENFLEAYAPKADPAALVDGLGEHYRITQTNIKKWAVGGPIQGPLDGLDKLIREHHLEADQVKEVIVRASPDDANTVNNREMPDICLQYMVAVMLIDKTATFRAAHDKARMQDPAIQRQRAKVKLIAEEQLSRRPPGRIAIVEVNLVDGTHLSERVEGVRGTAGNPMSNEEVVAKARDLIAPVLGGTQCTNLIAKILELENVADIRQLRPLLQRS